MSIQEVCGSDRRDSELSLQLPTWLFGQGRPHRPPMTHLNAKIQRVVTSFLDRHKARPTDMPTRFEARKQKILEQLDAPDDEYHDLSPKGSVDAPIRDLISEINSLQGLVTTSSCSGRISVFLEGRKADTEVPDPLSEGENSRAGPGGKGGGGAWLFISHTPAERDEANCDLMSKFGLKTAEAREAAPSVSCRYIHLKFEPMVFSVNLALSPSLTWYRYSMS
jgi:tRNA(Phe) wybutosine-synthesizing methylase Tyw3